MRNQEKDAIEMASKREKILEAGFRLFSQNSISTVSMNNVADACGVGIATVYRYFKTKPSLVMAIATWLWNNYVKENTLLLKETEEVHFSALQRYGFFIDTFIEEGFFFIDIVFFFFSIELEINTVVTNDTIREFCIFDVDSDTINAFKLVLTDGGDFWSCTINMDCVSFAYPVAVIG